MIDKNETNNFENFAAPASLVGRLVRTLTEYLQTMYDWCWFVLFLQRNEFHPKLRVNINSVYKGKTTAQKELKRITRLRQKAHELDLKWGAVNRCSNRVLCLQLSI